MNPSTTIRKALYQHVDSMVEGLISTVIVAGAILGSAAVIKLAVLYLIH